VIVRFVVDELVLVLKLKTS